MSYSNYSLRSAVPEKDPRFKTILNDVIKYEPGQPGKIVNFKFRPDPEKPNFYLRKYSPEKIRIKENIKNHSRSFLSREPYHRDGLSLRNR